MIYYNLTQCADVEGRKCYLRSTDVEQMNWRRLLWCTPDEMLFELATGGPVTIIDRSSNGRGKIERIFVPVMVDVLRWIWFDESPSFRQYAAHYEAALAEIGKDRMLHTRLAYYRRLTTWKLVLLFGQTWHVEKEANPCDAPTATRR